MKIKNKRNKIINIKDSKDLTINIEDCERFTLNLKDNRLFTIDISRYNQNYSVADNIRGINLGKGRLSL